MAKEKPSSVNRSSRHFINEKTSSVLFINISQTSSVLFILYSAFHVSLFLGWRMIQNILVKRSFMMMLMNDDGHH